MKLFLILLATAYASGAGIGYEGTAGTEAERIGYAPIGYERKGYEPIGYEPIGYEQPGFDRYSYGYGNPEEYGKRGSGLIQVPVPYVIGRQGIGFDKRTAFAYGFRMPLTLELLEVLRRYPEYQKDVKV